MQHTGPLPLVIGLVLLAALVVVLVLSVIGLKRASTGVVATAAVIAALALIGAVTSAPLPLSWTLTAPIAVVATAAAVVGGNPFTRRALVIATGARVRETEDGGIVIIRARADGDEDVRPTLMRGGTVIGYLERIGTALAILVGYPAAIAAIIAVKGVGRFPELAESEARERFIVGTLASLAWSAAVAAVARILLG